VGVERRPLLGTSDAPRCVLPHPCEPRRKKKLSVTTSQEGANRVSLHLCCIRAAAAHEQSEYMQGACAHCNLESKQVPVHTASKRCKGACAHCRHSLMQVPVHTATRVFVQVSLHTATRGPCRCLCTLQWDITQVPVHTATWGLVTGALHTAIITYCRCPCTLQPGFHAGASAHCSGTLRRCLCTLQPGDSMQAPCTLPS
jgi:hypothetical protein